MKRNTRQNRMTREERDQLIDAKVRDVIRRNVEAGIEMSKAELQRLRIETQQMVDAEQFTWADMVPETVDITEVMHQSYAVYQSPRDLK